MGLNFCSAVGIVVVNKSLFRRAEGLGFATFLTGLHFLATALGVRACHSAGLYELKPLKQTQARLPRCLHPARFGSVERSTELVRSTVLSHNVSAVHILIFNLNGPSVRYGPIRTSGRYCSCNGRILLSFSSCFFLRLRTPTAGKGRMAMN